MEFDKVVKERTSIRAYSERKPKYEDIIKIIETANLAPSPGNLQILIYIIVKDPETISKIAKCCQQNFISKAPYVVVICSNPRNTERAYEQRAKKYIRQHAGAAIENFLLKVTNMGLASCWIGAFSEPFLKTLLRVPEHMDIEAVLPVGYTAIQMVKTEQRRKPVLQDRLFFESFGNKYQKYFRSAHPG